MVTTSRRSRGFTFIELIVVLVITMIFAVIGLKLSGEVLRQNRLMNQARWIKSAFVIARARAIERAAPVRFTFNPTVNTIKVELDGSRTGTFPSSNIDLIMQETNSPYKRVNPGKASGIPALSDWGGGTIVDFADDEALEIVILPMGRVLAGEPLGPANGTIYFTIDSSSRATAAVQFSSLGIVRLAFNGGLNRGTSDWKDWVWVE